METDLIYQYLKDKQNFKKLETEVLKKTYNNFYSKVRDWFDFNKITKNKHFSKPIDELEIIDKLFNFEIQECEFFGMKFMFSNSKKLVFYPMGFELFFHKKDMFFETYKKYICLKINIEDSDDSKGILIYTDPQDSNEVWFLYTLNEFLIPITEANFIKFILEPFLNSSY